MLLITLARTDQHSMFVYCRLQMCHFIINIQGYLTYNGLFKPYKLLKINISSAQISVLQFPALWLNFSPKLPYTIWGSSTTMQCWHYTPITAALLTGLESVSYIATQLFSIWHAKWTHSKIVTHFFDRKKISNWN